MPTPKNQSIQKAFQILRAFKDPQERLSCAEISRRAGLPEASGYRLICTLLDVGAVVKDAKGLYRPGTLLISPAYYMTLNAILQHSAFGLLAPLSARLGLTVHLCVLEDDMLTYVAKAVEGGNYCTYTRAGTQLEAYCSAVGKMLLSALPGAELDSYLTEGTLVPLTPHTITDLGQFRSEIDMIRGRGFATDEGESHPALRCVATPVRGQMGETIAALSCCGPADMMAAMPNAAVLNLLGETAEAISMHVPHARPGRHMARRDPFEYPLGFPSTGLNGISPHTA